MGCFVYFHGGLKFQKPLNKDFKQFFNYYAKRLSFNDPYQPYGTQCPWFIDENDRLTLSETKCGDAHVWLEYISSRFLSPYGLRAKGTIYCTPEVNCDDTSDEWIIDTARYVMFARQDFIHMDKIMKSNYLPDDDSPYCYRVGNDI